MGAARDGLASDPLNLRWQAEMAEYFGARAPALKRRAVHYDERGLQYGVTGCTSWRLLARFFSLDYAGPRLQLL